MNDTKQTAITTEHGGTPEPVSMLAIIDRVASDPNADISKLERLLDLQERLMAKQAEIDFNEALTRISQDMPRIVRGRSVGYDVDKNDKSKGQKEAFKFAPYEEIDKIIRPLLIREGFSLSYTTEMKDGGGCIMHGTLSHKGGHHKTASVPLALDTSGGKNNIQAMGSTTSYGKRYTMCMLLNIVTVGEDDDAEGAHAVISTEQAVEIDMLLGETGLNKKKFLAMLKVPDVREIKLKDHARALNALKAKAYDDNKGGKNA